MFNPSSDPYEPRGQSACGVFSMTTYSHLISVKEKLYPNIQKMGKENNSGHLKHSSLRLARV